MTRSIALVLSILAFPAVLSAQEKGPFKLTWGVSPADVVVFGVQPGGGVQPAGGGSARKIRLHASSILPKGPAADQFRDLDGVSDFIALTLPPDGVSVGRDWKVVQVFSSLEQYSNTGIKGEQRLVGWVDRDGGRCLEVQGIYALLEADRSPGARAKSRVLEGRVTSKSWIDPGRAVVLGGQVQVEARVQKGTGEIRVQFAWNYAREDGWVVNPANIPFEVDEAVRKGVEWLKSRQRDDGSFPGEEKYAMGYTALSLLALLGSGVPRQDPVVVKGLEYLRGLPFEKVYSVGILLMLLEKLGDEVEKGARGSTVVGRGGIRLLPQDFDWLKRATEWLLAQRTRAGLWHYPAENESYDHSCVQYAALGLKSASRCGLAIPDDVWAKLIKHFGAAQWADGPPVAVERTVDDLGGSRSGSRSAQTFRAEARGWGYHAGQQPYGSMTTAGLACVLLAQSELLETGRLTGELRATAGKSLEDALAWMALNYSTLENPRGPEGWYYYYLYGLERAMIFSRTKMLGGHDWYLDGAAVLIKKQDQGGSWGSVSDTSFALLFLRRATAPIAITGD